MPEIARVKVAIIGSQFEAGIHAALQMELNEATVIAVASPTRERNDSGQPIRDSPSFH